MPDLAIPARIKRDRVIAIADLVQCHCALIGTALTQNGLDCQHNAAKR
jgi:hypothetical protein